MVNALTCTVITQIIYQRIVGSSRKVKRNATFFRCEDPNYYYSVCFLMCLYEY